MCLVITIIIFGFAVQNLMIENWLIGVSQLVIALGFLLLLINNIRRMKALKSGRCYNGCRITNFLKNLRK